MMRHFRKGDQLTSRVFREQLNKIVDTHNAVEKMTGDGLVVVNHTRTGMVVGLALDALRALMQTDELVSGEIWLDIQGVSGADVLDISDVIPGDWRGRQLTTFFGFFIGTPLDSDTNGWGTPPSFDGSVLSWVTPIGTTSFASQCEVAGGCRFILNVDGDTGHLIVNVVAFTARTQVRMAIQGWAQRRSTDTTGVDSVIGA